MSFFECPEDLLGALRPDARAVVVTDWMMDGCTGLELCERLRRFERSSGGAFYVIVMTGRQDRDAAVLALDSGADDFVRKPCDAEELGARIRVGWRLLEAESRLREANRRLQERAATDPLTGVRNRRAGHEVIETELARVDRDLQSLALIMVDLDHFKTINDRLGHPAGDAVLVRAASRLQGACRSYDTVIRWGGEEFLLVCPLEDPSQAERLGERLRRALADSPVEVPSQEPLAVTASVGLTVVFVVMWLVAARYFGRAAAPARSGGVES